MEICDIIQGDTGNPCCLYTHLYTETNLLYFLNIMNNSCDSCDSCNFCDSCNSCNFCNYCNSCNFCDSCNSCNFCNYCNFCKNLRMTEHNLFCWSEKYNDDNSFQQKRWRVFNKQVTEQEYRRIKIPKHKLEFDRTESVATRFKTAFKKMRSTLTKEQKQEYYDIPHFDWKWFTYITWVEKEDDVTEMTLADVCIALGKNIKIIK